MSSEFIPLAPGEYPELIAYCVVCHVERQTPDVDLNASGYCRACWERIPAAWRTPQGRCAADHKMFDLIVKTALRLRKDLPLPTLMWDHNRQMWAWKTRTGRHITKYGEFRQSR